MDVRQMHAQEPHRKERNCGTSPLPDSLLLIGSEAAAWNSRSSDAYSSGGQSQCDLPAAINLHRSGRGVPGTETEIRRNRRSEISI